MNESEKPKSPTLDGEKEKYYAPYYPLPPCNEWPQRPLLLRWHPERPVKIENGHMLAINSKKPFSFETELFKGQAMICIRYAPYSDEDPWAEGHRFHGKRRRVVMTVQGQFKERLRFDEVMCGWSFTRPLVNQPMGTNMAFKIFETFSPGTLYDVYCDKPYILNLLASAGDAMHIWRPGDPPNEQIDITKEICYERSGGSLPPFKNIKERCNYLKKKDKSGVPNSSKHYFDTTATYTFDCYGHLLLLDEFKAAIPGFPLKLAKYFNGQAFPFMASTKDGRYLWDFEIWNEETTVATPQEVWDPPMELQLNGHLRDKKVADVLSVLPTPSSRRASIERTECDMTFVSCTDGFGMTVRMDDSDLEDGSTPENDSCKEEDAISMSSGSLRRTPQTPAPPRLHPPRIRPPDPAEFSSMWDMWTPSPASHASAALMGLAVLAVSIWAVVWWHRLFGSRLNLALTSTTAYQDWLWSLLVLVVLAIFLYPLGFMTNGAGGTFFKWQAMGDSFVYGCLKLLLTLVIAIVEELVFRVLIIPHTSENVNVQSLVLFAALSVVLSVSHFPLIAITIIRYGSPESRPALAFTFDPRFIAMVALLGIACSVSYLLSGSVWPPAVIHASCAVAWLSRLGGARKLRRVQTVAVDTTGGTRPGNYTPRRLSTDRPRGMKKGPMGSMVLEMGDKVGNGSSFAAV